MKRVKKHVVKIDLPVETVKTLKRVAKRCNLTVSKVVNVLLVLGFEREDNQI